MMPKAALSSIATAVPPHAVNQQDTATMARSLFAGHYDQYEKLARVFDTSAILVRHLARPLEWYGDAHDWSERSAVYTEVASKLFCEAAQKALNNAGLSAGDVDTVITISSTGIATPSLEARVGHGLGFKNTIARIPVFGLGCAGGVTGLSLGARLAVAKPGSTVLVVAVELCSMAFHAGAVSKANIVASALFADGAAAAVIRAGEGGIATVEGSGEYTWPDTLDIMGWDVDQRGLNVIFDRAIPPFTRANMGPAVDAMLHNMNINKNSINRYICHPGGKKVITALEDAFGLSAGTLNHERDILAGYGNMSAPTVLFVLDRVINAGLPDVALMTAMGPGFTASCLALKKCQ